MRIFLIKPNIGHKIDGAYIDEGRMEPYQLGILAALTPSDIEVELWDDRMEKIPYDRPVDLVAITVETFTARRAYQICTAFRKRGVKVIVGGMHPTLIPSEAICYADAIMTGDAERCWDNVISDLRKGSLKQIYYSVTTIGEKSVAPRRSIYKGKGYLPVALTQFSRGCQFACTYCASSIYFSARQYCRKVDEVVKEIAESRQKLVFFVDDNITSDPKRAKELFRALIPLKIKWVSQADIKMTGDRELLKLMKDSGCIGNVIGFESLNKQDLQEMKKMPNVSMNDDYSTQIQIFRDYGLLIWAAFTIGHDNDTIESVQRLVDFAIKSKFTFAAFNILMPYPNTPLYQKLKDESRLMYDTKWWLHSKYRFNYAAFRPEKISASDLTHEAFEARKKFNSLSSFFSRLLNTKTHLRNITNFGTYITYNPLFRKEVYKKQGMFFGEKDEPIVKRKDCEELKDLFE